METQVETARRLERLRIIESRSPGHDGAFVFAVRSTGIYCRPSCPSRRPRPERVVFFGAPDEAERAGFRPCRRCRPREAGAGDPRSGWVRRVCRAIEARSGEPPRLADLARKAGVGPHHLLRSFKRQVGVTPRQYADQVRLARLKTHLRKGRNVTDALYEAGYGSSSRLYERAPGRLGMTPATYRKGGRGARIAYTIVPCALGRLLVAATDRGLCYVALDDGEAGVERCLRREYPEAEIRRDDAGLAPLAAKVLPILDGRPAGSDLPLDIRATAFQWKVYEALRAIPAGSTRSYREVARAVGRPKGARAVGRACATNPVSLVIPCHRVVREDGSLGGYGWGLERKRALLQKERGASSGRPARS